MILLFLIILLGSILYIFLSSVFVSFRLDSSLSKGLRITIFPFEIDLAKKKRGSLGIHQVEIGRLFFSEVDTVWMVVVVLCKFCKGLLKSKNTYLKISMKGGFGSPDITGFVYGTITAVKPSLGPRIKIACYPDLISSSLTGRIEIQAVFRAYRILAEVLLLLTRLPKLQLAKIAIKIHKGE